MTKNVGLTYVDEFSFPAEQGFTGSAGKQPVKGYMRGGRVKKDPVKAAAQTPRAAGPGVAQGGSVHDRLRAEGSKMGYAYGGQVKNTSSEFVQKSGKQDPMDSGTDPGVPRNQAEKEAGGRKRTKPKLKAGGRVRRVRMPKGVKAQGGLAKYAGGGRARSRAPSVGQLGTGAAANAARGMRTRELRTRETVDRALAAGRNAQGQGAQDRGPRRAAQRSPRPSSSGRPSPQPQAPGAERGKRSHYGLPFAQR